MTLCTHQPGRAARASSSATKMKMCMARTPPLRRSVGLVGDDVAQRPELGNVDGDGVAAAQVLRRIETRTGTRRRAGRDQVARHEAHEAREILDEPVEREDQV